MGKSNDLYLLIRSLSPYEKGYFKKYTSTHIQGGKNNYMRLFEALDAQKEYDEAEIKKALAKEPFIGHLHVVKNYLYDLILQSLAVNLPERSVEAKLNRLLESAEVLYNKALYGQCNAVLERAQKIAIQHEMNHEQLKILEMRLRPYLSRLNMEVSSEEDIKDFFAPIFSAVNFIENRFRFAQLQKIMLALHYRVELIRNPEDSIRIDVLVKDPLLTSERNALSLSSKIIYYKIWVDYHYTKGDYANSILYAKKQIDFLAKHVTLIKSEQKLLLIALFMKGASEVHLHLFKEATKTIRQITLEKATTEEIIVLKFTIEYSIQVLVYVRSGHFKEAIRIMPDIEAGMKKYKDRLRISDQVLFCLNISIALFIAGRLQDALKWTGKLLAFSGIEILHNSLISGRVLNLMIHYELDSGDLLDSYLRSTYRYLYKREGKLQFEMAFLSFFRRVLTQVRTNKDIIKAFTVLKKDLEGLLKDPVEKETIEAIFIIPWLESKIEDRPLASMVKQI